jgi:hypothetical protein
VKEQLSKINLKVLWHHKMAVQSIMAVRFLAFKKVSILELVFVCVCVCVCVCVLCEGEGE